MLCEAETDAFTPVGFYQYPDQRPFMQAIGLHDLGRRQIAPGATLSARLGEREATLVLDHMVTPLRAASADALAANGPADEVLAAGDRGQPLLLRKAVGKGGVFVLGSFLGKSYLAKRNEGLEMLISHVCAQAGVRPDFDILHNGGPAAGVFHRTGMSGRERLLWLVNAAAERTVQVVDRAGKLNVPRVQDLVGGNAVAVAANGGPARFDLTLPEGGWAVLSW